MEVCQLMLVTSDIDCVNCSRMGGSSICQHVDIFRLLANFVIDVIFLILLRSNHCSQMLFDLKWIFEYLFLQIPEWLLSVDSFDN